MEPFEILGLEKNTDISIVKKRFRELSLAKHPDKGGDENEYRIILEAYKEIIKKPTPKKLNKKGKVKQQIKKTDKDSTVDIFITLDEIFTGCERVINYNLTDSVKIKIKPGVGYMQVIPFIGKGKKNKNGKRSNLFVTIKIYSDDNFSFIKYYGRYELVHDVYLFKDNIPESINISIYKESKQLKLPLKIRNGMFLKVKGFGGFYDNKRGDLFIRINLLK